MWLKSRKQHAERDDNMTDVFTVAVCTVSGFGLRRHQEVKALCTVTPLSTSFIMVVDWLESMQEQSGLSEDRKDALLATVTGRCLKSFVRTDENYQWCMQPYAISKEQRWLQLVPSSIPMSQHGISSKGNNEGCWIKRFTKGI